MMFLSFHWINNPIRLTNCYILFVDEGGFIMRIIINHSSMIPIYEQTVDQIKKQINDHILQENDPLPFVRLLSKELRISALTVKKAYDTLDEEGLTKTIHGKGTFVLAVNKDLLEEAKKEIEEYLEKALQKAKQSGVSHKEVKELLELLMEE
jgi:GntR family transcriptional regulator